MFKMINKFNFSKILLTTWHNWWLTRSSRFHRFVNFWIFFCRLCSNDVVVFYFLLKFCRSWWRRRPMYNFAVWKRFLKKYLQSVFKKIWFPNTTYVSCILCTFEQNIDICFPLQTKIDFMLVIKNQSCLYTNMSRSFFFRLRL